VRPLNTWYIITICYECFCVPSGSANTRYNTLRVFFLSRVSPLNTRYTKILMYRVFIYSDCLCISITPGFKIKKHMIIVCTPRIKLSYIRPECEHRKPISLLYKLSYTKCYLYMKTRSTLSSSHSGKLQPHR
jgi:hypothetical protein